MARLGREREWMERQLREERGFLEERAAPGMDGWDEESARDPVPEEVRGLRGGRPGLRRGRHLVAGDIMTENPAAVTPDTPLAEVARTMRDLDVGIVPVVDDPTSRRLRGVVTDRDIAVRVVAEGREASATAADCMTEDVEACRPGDRIRDVLHLMERHRVRRVPVTDHGGALVGIIAQADLAVEYAPDDERRELRVEEAIERISEPARPRRGGRAR